MTGVAYKSQRLDGDPSAIKLFATDWSGVISDDRHPVYEADMKVLEGHGHPRMAFRDWLPRTTLTAIEFFANEGLVCDPDAIFEEFKEAYGESKRDGICPNIYPDAKETLRFISDKGIPIFVISSSPSEHLAAEAAEYGISDYVSAFAGDVRDKTASILKACSDAREEPAEAVYIGDTVYDVRSAKKAGVRSVGITTGYHTKERLIDEDPDFCFDSLSEFRKEMQSLLR